MWRYRKIISSVPTGQNVSFRKSYSSSAKKVLAIRREDHNVWERRAPLSPAHVGVLVKSGIDVLVQPSNRRAYGMQDYVKAGAKITEDISDASLIMGVKQVPIDALVPNKTYVFFSHTIKGQNENMPLLDALLAKNIRLIDYERMCSEDNKRVIAFGKYAGVAGMINILHGLGVRLLALGHHTPFMHIGPAHNYRNSMHARQAIRDAGYEIALGKMPKSIGPLTFVFTGSGNVSQGAQEVFQELPHEFIEPHHLSKVASQGASNKLYASIVSRENHYKPKNGATFDADEFNDHPERYFSSFSIEIAPYASVIINGIYYAPNSPRLISIPDAKNLLKASKKPWLQESVGCPNLPHHLLAVCDISADPGGSMEFMDTCTSLDAPFCLYNADEHITFDSFSGNGVLLCSIDNMPTQLPIESTDFFSSLLVPYIPEMLKSDAMTPFEELDVTPVLKNAVIVSNGKLAPNYEYISELRKTSSSAHKAKVSMMNSSKRVLILGAGYVAGPVVEYLSRDKTVAITVADQIKANADKLMESYSNTNSVLLEMGENNSEELSKMISEHDVIISLLPYTLHTEVAKECIKHKKHMVTASYLSEEMKNLHQAAVDAGITVLNEVGLDPGIDHLLSMKCFGEVADNGGKIKSFISWAGGLPAPESSNNPLRYKFSWSPIGVLRNVVGGAKYLENNKLIEVPAGGALLDNVRSINALPGFNLQGWPNRDSTKYADLYGIKGAHTILRGTLRYTGFADIVKAMVALGLIDEEDNPRLHLSSRDVTWRQLICNLNGFKSDIMYDSLLSLLTKKFEGNRAIVESLEDLGLLDDELVRKENSPLKTLSSFLQKRLSFGPGERDIIIMHNEIGVRYSNGDEETRNIDFVVYGNNKYTAMASTVGYPAAIAAKMILEGEIQDKGMILPLSHNIVHPMLKRLASEGLKAVETIVKHKK